MADGWARTTHEPGVATATCGPGVTQLATALVTAARANSPIVVFAGEAPSVDEEYPQVLDQSKFAAGCETGFVRLLLLSCFYPTERKFDHEQQVAYRCCCQHHADGDDLVVRPVVGRVRGVVLVGCTADARRNLEVATSLRIPNYQGS